MLEYSTLIGGEEEPGVRWTYVLDASYMIQNPLQALTYKRQLELGKLQVSDLPDPSVVIARCALATEDANGRAIAAAKRAFETFSQFPFAKRRAIIEDVRCAIEEKLDEFVDYMTTEGHPRSLAQWEVGSGLSTFSKESLDWLEAQLQQQHNIDGNLVKLLRRPDGVVCVNPPQNAAVANAVITITSLLAGNTMVIKAPRSTPFGVFFFFRDVLGPVLERHGAPPGTINVISQSSGPILDEWIAHPDTDNLIFFGSSSAGLRFGERCYEAGKKSVLELSGNDPYVVWSDADIDAASSGLLESFYGSSQICMVPKLAIVHPAIAVEFIESFLSKVSDIRPALPGEQGAYLSPVLKAPEFIEYLDEAVADGAIKLCGGSRIELNGEPSPRGLFIEPTVLRVNGLERAGKLRCVTEETFFPLLPIVVPESDVTLRDVASFANRLKYGLRCSLWTKSRAVADEFVSRSPSVGQIKVNCSHLGIVPVLATHGGPGWTGGPYGELNYFALRTSHLQGVCSFDGGLA